MQLIRNLHYNSYLERGKETLHRVDSSYILSAVRGFAENKISEGLNENGIKKLSHRDEVFLGKLHIPFRDIER